MKFSFLHGSRQFWRDWRSGEMLALGGALLTAVAAVSAVSSFSDRVEDSLQRGAGEVIASDIKLTSRAEISEIFEERAVSLGLRTARTVTFPTVLFIEGQTLLASVKGVTPGYPLRGALGLRKNPQAPELVSVSHGPGRGQAWVDKRLLGTLGLTLGDRLDIGEVSLTLASVLAYEPDRGGQFFSFSPRIMVHRGDIEASGLLGPSSRATFALLAVGSTTEVSGFRDFVERRRQDEIRIVDLQSAQRQVGATVGASTEFIGLASLGTLFIAGIAIAVAARRYVDRRRKQAALLRCFGASGRTILLIHIQTLLMMGMVWGLVGAAIGFAVQELMTLMLGEVFSLGAGEAGWSAVVISLILGLTLLVGFSVPELARLMRVAPMEVLRRTETPVRPVRDALWYAVPVLALVLLTVQQAGQTRLVFFVLLGIVAALIAMMGVSLGILRLMKRAAHGVGVSWRFGLGRLYRDSMSTTFQIAAIGLGLTVLVTLSLIRGQLFDNWEARVPAGSPNFFLANIQDYEKEGLDGFFAEHLVEKPSFTPMATGRLVTINGRMPTAEDYPDPRTASRIEGNLNFSWSRDLPKDNRLVSGKWWQPDTTEAVVSLAESWAEPLGVTVGDRIGVRVGSKTIDARIMNLREVRWESFNPNFFVLFPPAAFQNAPHTFLSAIRLEEARQDELVELSRQFPTVNIIDIGAILGQVRHLIEVVGVALNLVFGFTLIAGAVVLYAVMQSSHDSRIQDAAMLKVLGCDRRRLLLTLNTEFAVIALIAGIIAAGAASLTGWLLASQVFNLDYAPGLLPIATSILLSVVIVWLVSRSGVEAALRSPPQATLRAP
jgi:putative ABC transport system permease protein